MKAPRQMKHVYPLGTKVIYSFWWYGREHKHDGHLCEVVKQWVRVAGAKPRNFYKYRLRCLHPGCNGGEFNMEDTSATCQGISEANTKQLEMFERARKRHKAGSPPPQIMWGEWL